MNVSRQWTQWFLVRYSLRTALVGMGLFAIYLGNWNICANRHAVATRNLANRGVPFWSGFEEPIGPNFLYTWSQDVPPNGYFSPWFAELFCIGGNEIGMVDGIELSDTDWQLFGNLVRLKHLSIANYDGSPDWTSHLSRCRELEMLEISSTRLSSRDVENLCKLKSLKVLVLLNTGLTTDELRILREKLSNCEILVE
jgi:hypothetical protein